MRSIRDRREQRRDGKMRKRRTLGSPFTYRSSAGNDAEERERGDAVTGWWGWI